MQIGHESEKRADAPGAFAENGAGVGVDVDRRRALEPDLHGGGRVGVNGDTGRRMSGRLAHPRGEGLDAKPRRAVATLDRVSARVGPVRDLTLVCQQDARHRHEKDDYPAGNADREVTPEEDFAELVH